MYKQITWLAKAKQYYFHPFLISLLYILIVIRLIHTSESPVSNNEIYVSSGLVLLITLISFFLSSIILKDNIKAAVVTSLFLCGSLLYAHINISLFNINILVSQFKNFFLGNPFLTSIILLLLFFTILNYLLFLIPFRLIKLNNYLNILLIVFLLFELCNHIPCSKTNIILKEENLLKLLQHPLTSTVENNKNPIQETVTLPNIYYLVFDAYTNFECLKKYWNYENSELANFLKRNGFYIAPSSRSNYNQTHFNLAATLNLNYLEYQTFDKLDIPHIKRLSELIKNNILIKILQKHGYEIVNYTLFDFLNSKKHYTFNVIETYNFFKNTMFEEIFKTREIVSSLGLSVLPQPNIIKTNIEIKNEIKNFVQKNKLFNTFMYAHFMLPHPPYYFDACGNIMSPEYANDQANMWKYLEQVKYTNIILMETVEHILSNSTFPPVIIIQGDHGFRMLNDTTAQKDESHAILNAFYFPDKDYSLLYPNISSINTFRVLLKKLNLLEINTLHNESIFIPTSMKGRQQEY